MCTISRLTAHRGMTATFFFLILLLSTFLLIRSRDLSEGEKRSKIRLGSDAKGNPGSDAKENSVPVKRKSVVNALEKNNAQFNWVIDKSLLEDALLYPDGLGTQIQLSPELGGVRITKIAKGSVFERWGFQEGDVIQSINNDVGAILSYENLIRAIGESTDLSVQLRRGNRTLVFSYKGQDLPTPPYYEDADHIAKLAEEMEDTAANETHARMAAIQSLGEIGGGAAIRHLEKALLDSDPVIRLFVVEIAAQQGEEGHHILFHALADLDETVRSRASELLSWTGS